MNILVMVSLVVISMSAAAKDIQLKTHAARRTYIEKATVWKAPPKNLTAQDVFDGPAAKGYAKLLTKNRVYCQTTQEDQEGDFGGRTPKFYCQLLKPISGNEFEYITKDSGDRRVIKVKYHPPGVRNYEIQGEILGTRLLWSLGFYADQMFYVDEVYCYGCTKDPFRNRKVVSTDPRAGNVFKGTAIERKLSGDMVESSHRLAKPPVKNGVLQSEIIWSAGVEFKEMMAYLPREGRSEQYVQRDALRLLAIFMQHTDLKSDNQRMLCVDKNSKGQCTKAIMMIQDIGSSFGVEFNTEKLKLTKVNLALWKSNPIWKDPLHCEAQIAKDFPVKAFLADSSMRTPIISNEGRLFLAKLLTDFSQDKERVRALFRAARVDSNELEGWVSAFMSKVQQIRFPMGTAQPNFKCH